MEVGRLGAAFAQGRAEVHPMRTLWVARGVGSRVERLALTHWKIDG